MKQIVIYDTTLRDGNQAEDVNLSLADKIKVALKLDEFGISYIEGGWPGASPVDTAFFQEIANYDLKTARIAAFGATHDVKGTAEKDPGLADLVAARPHAATIFGKSCEQHVREALRTTPEKYLPVVGNSIAFLARHLPEAIFDAEHFFDGYARNAEYALAVLKTAHEAGARYLVLCDTNGGNLPEFIVAATRHVREILPDAAIGIHAHNDCELGVANALAAVETGAVMVQGTINGVGERCGNTNLCSLIPVLELKSNGAYRCLPEGRLPLLRNVSNYVSEVVNMSPFSRQPFVGRSAFAHKGGVHVSAVNRNSSLYEHVNPEEVGNVQRILLTELAGRSNIVSMAKSFGFHLDKDEPVVKGLLAELKHKASEGYDYAAAEASVELLLMRKLGRRGVRDFFTLKQWRVLESKYENGCPSSEATVCIEVEGAEEHTASSGSGPVNALDNALRKALAGFYPKLAEMRLIDFKVRVLAGNGAETDDETSGGKKTGSASMVRVLIESADHTHKWVTVGVSFDIIEASWQALLDSITYKLYKDENEYRRKVVHKDEF